MQLHEKCLMRVTDKPQDSPGTTGDKIVSALKPVDRITHQFLSRLVGMTVNSAFLPDLTCSVGSENTS